MTLTLSTPLSAIPSVGEKRKGYLARLDLNTVSDLLFFFPRHYHDLRNFKAISRLVPGEVASVKGRILAREEKRPFRRVSYLKVVLHDGSGCLYLIFFNQPYLKEVFTPEKEFFVNGRVDIFRNEMQMVNPVYEAVQGIRRDWVLPVYPLTRGLTVQYLRKLVKFAFRRLTEYPPELLSFSRRQRLGLANIRYALNNIHFPRSDMDLEKARNYLIFHEFFKLQLGLLFQKTRTQASRPGTEKVFSGSRTALAQFEEQLPFKLTEDQKAVIEELQEDLRKGRVLQRLIQGEVGSGKTVVAIFALWLFAVQGGQAVFLSPTEILAEQHFLNWQEFFLRQNIPVALFIRELPAREKAALKAKMKTGELKVVIGTHALLAEDVSFADLQVAVVDEQHKFGVKQRENLREKAKQVHYVILSATPIPRSVALTFYGTLDFSTIGQLPKGQRKVITHLFSGEEKERVYQFLSDQARQKKQGYLVTPAIEGREDIQSAVQAYEYVKRQLPGIPCGLVHGRLPRDQQEALIRKFRQKELLLLVATTVIESGLDVPEASYIVIDQAERFGLAQLHQLRGRVGRSGQVGYCLLVCYSRPGEATERLEMFLETESGLQIAEKDLKIRGPGDLLGTRQHGVLPLKIGNIVSDLKILAQARRTAEEILEEDPGLCRPENSEVRKFIGGIPAG